MSENNISDEILLFRSFARLLYSSYRIYNQYKDQRINYYENANQIFQEIIEDDENSISYYNKCCFVLFGNDENFCGRFSTDYLKKAKNILNKHYNELLGFLTESNELVDFFEFIYEPVIINLYNEYIEELQNENETKLKSFMFLDENVDKQNCSICMESMIEIESKEKKIIKFDCNHYFHYDCIFKWFMEKQCCPICRKEF